MDCSNLNECKAESLKQTPDSFKKALLELSQKSKVPLDGRSCILLSASSRGIVDAFKNKSPLISVVPFDMREASKEVFLTTMKEGLTEDVRTNPLLCSLGSSGSGKTVQQVLNMCWFEEYQEKENRSSLAIEVSFNDDFDRLGLRKDGDFVQAMVRGILLRVVEHCAGKNFTESKSIKDAQMMGMLNIDFSQLGLNICSAIALAREALGFGENAPVFLAVDGLGKRVNPTDSLKNLCETLEEEGLLKLEERRHWLSASTLGCFHLRDFRRKILLQPLPPLFLESFSEDKFKSLPAMVRLLNCPTPHPELTVMKGQLSNILLRTGGHPRALSEVIGQLHLQEKTLVKGCTTKEGEGSVQATPGDPSGLLMWLEKSPKSFAARFKAICEIVEKNISSVKSQSKPVPKVELEFTPSLLRDLVVPFHFPTVSIEAENHGDTLYMIESAFGHYLPDPGLSFIPFPIIEKISKQSTPLTCLSKSIIEYSSLKDTTKSGSSPTNKKGRAFEVCIANALQHYFSRQTSAFTLRPICRTALLSESSVFDLPLSPLPLTPFDEETIIRFPTAIHHQVAKTPSLKCADPALLSGLEPGLYMPSDESNSGDLIAIFRVYESEKKVASKKKVAIIFEVKDWFQPLENKYSKTAIAHWRWSQQFFRSTGDVPLAKSQKDESVSHEKLPKSSYLESLKKAGFEVGFVLFSANHHKMVTSAGVFSKEVTLFDSDTTSGDHPNQLRSDEALMDLEDMRMWFPTVAYNVLAAHKINQYLYQDPTD